jgi:hypothetical protein
MMGYIVGGVLGSGSVVAGAVPLPPTALTVRLRDGAYAESEVSKEDARFKAVLSHS